MSHSLNRKGRTLRGMARHSRSVRAYLTGNLGVTEVRILQHMLDSGTLSHVEVTRDGTWFSGKPGAEFRALVRWFLDNGFEKADVK